MRQGEMVVRVPRGFASSERRAGTVVQEEVHSRILVIDDDPDACEALRQVLASKGYDATPETAASRALERVAHQNFDLILTDVSMAEMDGLELCRRILVLGSSVAGAILGAEIAALAVVGRTAEPAAYVMALGGAMMVVALYEALSYRSATP